MEIEVLSPESYNKYSDFLLSSSESLLYHSIEYKEFLENLLNCSSHYLLIRDNNKIISALPLMLKNGPLGTIANSLPYYGSNGGVIGSRDAQAIKLYQDEINKLNLAAITLTSSPAVNSIHQLSKTITDQRISQITPLENHGNPEDYILSIIDASSRRNIKKAIKNNITIKITNHDGLKFLEETHYENMAVIGGKAKSKNFFATISDYFAANTNYRIYTAFIDEIPVAALLVFYFNTTVEYFTPVVKHEVRSLQPLSAILLQAMSDAIKDGFKHWNWGGTWLTQQGVYKFKKKWGALSKIYNYSTHIYNNEILNNDSKTLFKEYDGFYIYNFNSEFQPINFNTIEEVL